MHGLLFYAVFRLAAPRTSLGARLVAASLIEACWEILENSPAVIARYRFNTVSETYAGDSVLNSASDALFMIAGFFVAAVSPAWFGVALGVGLEAAAALVIRDGLTLNIVMLLWPQDWIRAWQAQVWR